MSRVKEWKFYALLCQNIKEELKRKGLRFREVAPALGMSLSHFCNKITGHGTFSVFEVCKLAKWLEIPVIDLMEGLEA